MTKLGVIILNYFSSEDSISLYRSIKNFEFNDIICQILVVDNSCNPIEAKALESEIIHSDLIISKKNDGYATGNNRGIKHLLNQAKIDYFLILNPDVRFDPSIISKLLIHFEHNKNLAAIGPRIVHRDEPEVIYSDGGMVSLINGILQPSHKNYRKVIEKCAPNSLVDTSYVHGACMMISARALDEISLISEEYFLYFEELDWCQKAISSGWDIKVDSDCVASQAISKQNEKYYFYFTRGHIIFNKKFNPLGWSGMILFYFNNIIHQIKSKDFRRVLAILLGLIVGCFHRPSRHSPLIR
ncbi:glycosyltransferase family 2 protein [Reichenbachiella sp. MALMAid0571]|uniref:glycosyltransferase family 2 protein n=1 Tax=Reichenbachiella sp. MALMAid0571 TaxID=3143939 RepID=UPI0032DE33FC